MSNAFLSIVDLKVVLGGSEILLGLSADFAAGSSYAVVGPNGAGKSTLLKVLSRIIPMAAGQIQLQGLALSAYSQLSLAKVAAYVPQELPGPVPYSAAELVALSRFAHLGRFGRATAADHKAVDQALDLCGCRPWAQRPFQNLSGGEKQLVLIAAALAQEPQLLLLDEPTAFLDPRHQAEVLRVLQLLRQQLGCTMIMVTHDINHAALAADWLLGLKNGQISFRGTAVDFMRPAVLRDLFQRDFLLVPHPHSQCLMALPRYD